MRLRAGLFAIGLLVAAGVAFVGSSADAAPGTRLRAFDGCPSFLDYVKRQALPLVGPYGLQGGAIGIPVGAARDAVAGAKGGTETDFSGTNVQEEGVDEPDMVKTDGRTLFVASGGRISALDVRSGRPRTLGTLSLDKGWTHELLLHGNRLLVLSQGTPGPIAIDARAGIRPWPSPAKATIAEVDVGDPAQMKLLRTLELDGGYLAARLVGRTARIVLASPMPVELPFVRPVDPGAIETGRATSRTRSPW